MPLRNLGRIICFGDSITSGYFPYFEEIARDRAHRERTTPLLRGRNGETSADGLRRLPQIVEERPDAVVLGFGMNDLLCGVPAETLERNLKTMLGRFEDAGIRVVLNTLNPILRDNDTSEALARYDAACHRAARAFATPTNDVRALWQEELESTRAGLEYEDCDLVHPNHRGHRAIALGAHRLVRRTFTKVVWQFNGANAQCNYRCEYCYMPSDFHEGHHFAHGTEAWEEAFVRTFRKRRLNFYLSFGEPMVAKSFLDVVRMVERNPLWKLTILSNLSPDLRRLLEMPIAQEGRLAITGSFHPSQVPLERFLDRVLLARAHGVEIPVVYVMYPEQIRAFVDEYFPVFQQHRVLTHVRRFRGLYKGWHYPSRYTREQLHTIARFMDDRSIRYMLKDEVSSGKLSYAGMSYLGVDHDGRLWVCPDWAGEEWQLGNVFDGTANIGLSPRRLGGYFSDGTTDGVANLVETDMDELDDNHIRSYAEQVGYRFTDSGVVYPNLHTDFDRRPIDVPNIYEPETPAASRAAAL